MKSVSVKEGVKVDKQKSDPIPDHIKEQIIQFFIETSAPRLLKEDRKSKLREGAAC